VRTVEYNRLERLRTFAHVNTIDVNIGHDVLQVAS
jgi:hypothetical protein